MGRLNGWFRTAAVLSAVWAAMLVLIALYERSVVDPWTFLGQKKGPIFFSWSRELVHDGSSFGELALVFDRARFAAALVGPLLPLWLWLLAVLLRAIVNRIRSRAE